MSESRCDLPARRRAPASKHPILIFERHNNNTKADDGDKQPATRTHPNDDLFFNLVTHARDFFAVVMNRRDATSFQRIATLLLFSGVGRLFEDVGHAIFVEPEMVRD